MEQAGKPSKMMLFICERCETLLVKIDQKYTFYTSSELEPNGWYVERNREEEEHDYYVCPMCSGNNCDWEPNSQEHTLKSIELPIEIAGTIRDMWKQEVPDETPEDEGYKYEYGIPMTDSRLKELLTEHLI